MIDGSSFDSSDPFNLNFVLVKFALYNPLFSFPVSQDIYPSIISSRSNLHIFPTFFGQFVGNVRFITFPSRGKQPCQVVFDVVEIFEEKKE